jgi:hypothetical protein
LGSAPRMAPVSLYLRWHLANFEADGRKFSGSGQLDRPAMDERRYFLAKCRPSQVFFGFNEQAPLLFSFLSPRDRRLGLFFGFQKDRGLRWFSYLVSQYLSFFHFWVSLSVRRGAGFADGVPAISNTPSAERLFFNSLFLRQ